MFKLTVEFQNNQELIDFVLKLGGLPKHAAVEQTMPVAVEQSEAPAKPAKAPKQKKVEEPKHEYDVEVPPVIEAPKPAAPAKPKFDREIAMTFVKQSIEQLTKEGTDGATLAKALAEIYVNAGCPAGVKISQLDDAQLEAFFPHFSAYVAKAKGEAQVPKQTASFI